MVLKNLHKKYLLPARLSFCYYICCRTETESESIAFVYLGWLRSLETDPHFHSCMHVTPPPVYQIRCGLFTQQWLLLSHSDVWAMIGYHHAETSPTSASDSLLGPQMVVCIEHELWFCVIWMRMASFPGCDISIICCCQGRFHPAGLVSMAECSADAQWQMRLTSAVAAVWQHKVTVTQLVDRSEIVPLKWLPLWGIH